MAEQVRPGMGAEPAKPGVHISCVGAFRGSVALPSLDTTLGELRRLIAERLGDGGQPRLICSGRNLDDAGSALSAYGLTPASKVLVMRGKDSSGAQQVDAQAEQAAKLDRLKAAVDAMASRDMPTDETWGFAIENQAGQSLALTEGDRRALGMGLALHSRGQQSLQQGEVHEALQQLLIAEEAFETASAGVTAGIDNVAQLKLDIVWCIFCVRDASKLAVAAQRLAAARAALQTSHGAGLERLRVLQGGFRPELALYVRLELLEGVAAFHAGQRSDARRLLQGAQAKWRHLQVSDASVAALCGLGFTPQEARRALRFCDGDRDRAAEFAMQQQRLAKERKDKAREDARERREQQAYGRTLDGRPVMMQTLGQLQRMLNLDGTLIAAALVQTNNNGEEALDMLTDEGRRLNLLQQLSAREFTIRRKRSRDDSVPPEGEPQPDEGDADADAEEEANDYPELAEGDPDASAEDPEEAEERAAAELENDIAAGISEDPLAAYDVDVAAEGEAIAEYLGLLGGCE